MPKGRAKADCPLSPDAEFSVCRCYVGVARAFEEVAGRKPKSETDARPSIDLDKSFGPNLKYWRAKRGYSQERLAELAEIHRTEVGLLENGKREPKYGIINKLAGALGIEQGELFKGATFIPSDDGEGRFTYDPLAPIQKLR
jgi:DNA-binding XRE family transcriptional regulator